MSLFNDNEGRCHHPKAEPRRLIAANGAVHFVMVCIDCDASVDAGRFHPYDRSFGKPDEPAIWRDYRGQNPPCEHCGAPETEEHHLAPKAAFDDPDEWPTAYLCNRCHQLWHLRIARAVLDGKLRP